MHVRMYSGSQRKFPLHLCCIAVMMYLGCGYVFCIFSLYISNTPAAFFCHGVSMIWIYKFIELCVGEIKGKSALLTTKSALTVQ